MCGVHILTVGLQVTFIDVFRNLWLHDVQLQRKQLALFQCAYLSLSACVTSNTCNKHSVLCQCTHAFAHQCVTKQMERSHNSNDLKLLVF